MGPRLYDLQLCISLCPGEGVYHPNGQGRPASRVQESELRRQDPCSVRFEGTSLPKFVKLVCPYVRPDNDVRSYALLTEETFHSLAHQDLIV